MNRNGLTLMAVQKKRGGKEDMKRQPLYSPVYKTRRENISMIVRKKKCKGEKSGNQPNTLGRPILTKEKENHPLYSAIGIGKEKQGGGRGLGVQGCSLREG